MATAQKIRSTLKAAGVEVPPLSIKLPREPEPILGFDVDSAFAIDRWKEIRAVTEATGYYPVVVGDEHGLLSDLIGEADPPDQIIGDAADADGADYLERLREGNQIDDENPATDESPAKADRLDRFVVPWDLISGKPRDNLFIALLPTKCPWEAAAHLGFQSVNYDIRAETHVAVHRHWHATHGAELVTCAGDTLEFLVARPPATPEAALALAREHYAYSPDIVEQGVGTVGALAHILHNAEIWFFWWD